MKFYEFQGKRNICGDRIRRPDCGNAFHNRIYAKCYSLRV